MQNTPALSFVLEDNLTHGLVGPNGVGKTTLLRMIAGQLKSEGLKVFGESPFDNQKIMDRIILMGIDNPLFDGWNVDKLFRIGKARWKTWNQERAEELAAQFALPKKNYSGLSRGQKSAMGFIFAVASGCELMLLDEPYLGLDVDKRQRFFEVLREEQGKRTIVVSTHHLDEIEGYLDTVLLLGEAPLSGPIESLVDCIVAVTGPAEQVDRALGRLQLPVLARHSSVHAERVLIDARPNFAECVFDQAAEFGLRAQEVTLEEAVLALGGAQ
ncbi:AAA family ATPase [Corynebacterium striatum]|uniref:AAA family ATPase n=1 Tax=Corynebacterium striatum TaxID=43770 RepID=UPI003ACBB04F